VGVRLSNDHGTEGNMAENLNDFDELFKITCGNCGASAPVQDWSKTSTGPMPPGEFQYPSCRFAFKRQRKENSKAWEKLIELVPTQAQL